MLRPELLVFAFALPLAAADFDVAATATNQLGLDLFRQLATERPGENFVISPYAVQDALALVYSVADGTTRSEMARALHFPSDTAVPHSSFDALRAAITPPGKPAASLEWNTASRLFAQQGYPFRDSFLTFVQDRKGAPPEFLDFLRNPGGAQVAVNTWIAQQTATDVDGIPPPRGVNSSSRLVLASAFSFQAQWEDAFDPAATRPRRFHVSRSSDTIAFSMVQSTSSGYAKREGFSAILLPYGRSDLQLLILLPDEIQGVDELSRRLTPPMLRDCAKLPNEQITLVLPEFRIRGTTFLLGKTLQQLGMTSLFDRSAETNFDRMVSRKPDYASGLSEMIHFASIRTNDTGSTSRGNPSRSNSNFSDNFDRGYGTYNTLDTVPSGPSPVFVDHPFLFAVLHRATGTCLLLGRVTDPR